MQQALSPCFLTLQYLLVSLFQDDLQRALYFTQPEFHNRIKLIDMNFWF
jgi:hypothetical protein